MLSPNLATLRLFLHVLAASVWVGGQVVLVGVIPALRASYPDATRVVAKAYGRVAWPAFAIAVVTGIWNLLEVDADGWTAYQITLGVKILLVTVSGLAAAVHQVGRSKVALAVGGAVGFVTALGAMYVGLLLTTGT
jgi:uncharacterized membrane protein